MAFLKVKNRAASTLASGVSDTATTWTVAAGEGSKFPGSGDFHITCEDEIVKCTARSGDVLTVTRAQEGTSAASHGAGQAVELRVTAGVIENIQEEAIAKSLLTTQGDIIVRGASAPERLGIGTKRFFPRVDSAGTALEYVRAFPFEVAGEMGTQFFDWTTTVTGSASEVSKGYGIIEIQTGTTANSTARSRGYSFGWVNWTDFRIVWRISLYNNAKSANSKRWIKIDVDASGDPTCGAIGFRIDVDAIKGIIHDGTSLTVVDLNSIFSGNTLMIIYDGTTVYWYVDDVLKGSSTNVPSGADQSTHYLMINVTNGSDTTNNKLRSFLQYWIKEV